MADHFLVADNLSVSRGGQPVLESVSFTVDKGDVFALLGGNGAGKSTTLLTLLGLVAPSSGQALIDGHKVQDDPSRIRQVAAYLPESANLYPHLNARENIDYFLSLAGIKETADAIESALDRVALRPDARGRRLASYSKGMRQKVAIALAILRGAPLLLLDEPTSGLDPVAIDEFNALVRDLSAQGTTIVMVTHDVYGACKVAQRVGLLRHGRLVELFDAPENGQFDPEQLHQAFSAQH